MALWYGGQKKRCSLSHFSLSEHSYLALILLVLLYQRCQYYLYPLLPDQSKVDEDLSDRLNTTLIERFVNQSRLGLAPNLESADAFIEGRIQTYTKAICYWWK